MLSHFQWAQESPAWGSDTGGAPSVCRELLPEKATLQEKQKLCSVSSTCKVAATMGHFGWEPATPGRRAAGNSIEASCSQESERPGTQASREAPGLCGRRPGSGMRSLRTRYWARRRLTITTLEAQAQTPARRAPRWGTCAHAEELHGRAPHPSSHHLHIQTSISLSGRHCYTATLKSWPHFP